MTSRKRGHAGQNLGTPVSLFSIPASVTALIKICSPDLATRFPRRVRILFAYQVPARYSTRLPSIYAHDRAHAKSLSISFYTRNSRFLPRRDARAMLGYACRRVRVCHVRVHASLEIKPLVALTCIRVSLEIEHMVALTGCFAINSRKSVTYY